MRDYRSKSIVHTVDHPPTFTEMKMNLSMSLKVPFSDLSQHWKLRIEVFNLKGCLRTPVYREKSLTAQISGEFMSRLDLHG